MVPCPLGQWPGGGDHTGMCFLGCHPERRVLYRVEGPWVRGRWRHPQRSRSSGGARDLPCNCFLGSPRTTRLLGRSLGPLVKARAFGMTPKLDACAPARGMQVRPLFDYPILVAASKPLPRMMTVPPPGMPLHKGMTLTINKRYEPILARLLLGLRRAQVIPCPVPAYEVEGDTVKISITPGSETCQQSSGSPAARASSPSEKASFPNHP